MVSSGVGGALTGHGADLAIIDDPVKNAEDAMSATMRDKAWDWYQATWSTRLHDGASEFLIMTRWHEDDLAGRILAAAADGEMPPWDVIRMPALAEEDDPLGRAVGEPLAPAMGYDLRHLEERRLKVGQQWWDALYQQRPNPEGGRFFHRDWLVGYHRDGDRIYSDVLSQPISLLSATIFSTLDIAATEDERNDYTVIGTWALWDDPWLLVLLDVDRQRVEGPEVVSMIQNAEELHQPILIAGEKNGVGLPILQFASRLISTPIEGVDAGRKSKTARAMPAQARIKAGQVLFPKNAGWWYDYQRELTEFPLGGHDDQVDMTAYAVLLANDFSSISYHPTARSDTVGAIDRIRRQSLSRPKDMQRGYR